MTIRKRLSGLGIAWLISAVPVLAATSSPDPDPYVIELYEYSCMACHSGKHSEQTGAPLAGDRAAWAPRIKRGMEQLVTNTVNGVGAMPPLGSCSDCTVEDFEALIIFMSGMPQENNKQ
jgi:cytochrome c5